MKRALFVFLFIVGVGAWTKASAEDNRDADRQAIRAHLDKIFKAFAVRDIATIRKTHAEDWIGFTQGLDQSSMGSKGI